MIEIIKIGKSKQARVTISLPNGQVVQAARADVNGIAIDCLHGVGPTEADDKLHDVTLTVVLRAKRWSWTYRRPRAKS